VDVRRVRFNYAFLSKASSRHYRFQHKSIDVILNELKWPHKMISWWGYVRESNSNSCKKSCRND
jgi:hypothetical protein